MSNELKPCPFCGNDIIEIGHQKDRRGNWCIYAYCVCCLNRTKDCKCTCEAEKKAVKKWNARKEESSE